MAEKFELVKQYLMVKKYTDTLTALLAVSLLSTNYIIFAYSRLAILELPMTCIVLLSILLTSSFPRANNFIIIGMSSVLFCVSFLTKTTALFAIAPGFYLKNLKRGFRSVNLNGESLGKLDK